MPIRINLLAETQAAEESRRKDPVKRAILAGVLLVCAAAVWSSTYQVKIAARKKEYNGLQSTWKSIEKPYLAAIETQYQSKEAGEKLAALQQLTTNRFLWGTALNALQQTLNGIDDVQVLNVKTEQTYTFAEEVKPKAGDAHPVAAKPATATEKIIVTIDGVDSSSQPGGKINAFKSAIAGEPFFQSALHKTNGVILTTFTQPQTDGTMRNSFVKFTLQCLFAEKVR